MTGIYNQLNWTRGAGFNKKYGKTSFQAVHRPFCSMNTGYSAFPPHFYIPGLTTTADHEQSGNNDRAQITEYMSDLSAQDLLNRIHRQIYVLDNDEFEYSAERAASIPNFLRDHLATRHHDTGPMHSLARQLDYRSEFLPVHEATTLQDDSPRWDTGPAITPSALFTGYFGERPSSTGYHVSVGHSLTGQLNRREEIFPVQKTTTQPDDSHGNKCDEVFDGQLHREIDFELGLSGIHQMSRMDWGLNMPPVHNNSPSQSNFENHGYDTEWYSTPVPQSVMIDADGELNTNGQDASATMMSHGNRAVSLLGSEPTPRVVTSLASRRTAFSMQSHFSKWNFDMQGPATPAKKKAKCNYPGCIKGYTTFQHQQAHHFTHFSKEAKLFLKGQILPGQTVNSKKKLKRFLEYTPFCPGQDCPKPDKTFIDPRGLQRHLINVHRMTMTDAEALIRPLYPANHICLWGPAYWTAAIARMQEPCPDSPEGPSYVPLPAGS
ncbi:hypothetical protein BU17DRAFT_71386 [Hysterangium stoloniferum]|nr:hypothetical protein BU17DRAFT_71386 [Hysterangium stoloniferum]